MIFMPLLRLNVIFTILSAPCHGHQGYGHGLLPELAHTPDEHGLMRGASGEEVTTSTMNMAVYELHPATLVRPLPLALAIYARHGTLYTRTKDRDYSRTPTWPFSSYSILPAVTNPFS